MITFFVRPAHEDAPVFGTMTRTGLAMLEHLNRISTARGYSLISDSWLTCQTVNPTVLLETLVLGRQGAVPDPGVDRDMGWLATLAEWAVQNRSEAVGWTTDPSNG